MADLVCAPTMQPGAVLAGDVIGMLCPHCHHSNVVHDTHRNVCVLCDLQQLTAHLREART